MECCETPGKSQVFLTRSSDCGCPTALDTSTEMMVARQGSAFFVWQDLPDEDNLVVHEGEHCYVVLNLFPYNPGHLLVCPNRHIGQYDEASEAETAEIASLTKRSMQLLREVAGAHGFNIGMNQGRVAGAGIEEHLHQHVVPRWGQDSNFFPIIAKTKAMPQLLGDIRDQLRSAWSQ